MKGKLGIIKVTGEGEQTNVEIELDDLDLNIPLLEQLRPYFKVMDDRLLEMNKRVVAANYLAKKLPAEAQMAIHNLQDVLHGRKAGPDLEQVLREAADNLQKEREKGEEKPKGKKERVGNA